MCVVVGCARVGTHTLDCGCAGALSRIWELCTLYAVQGETAMYCTLYTAVQGEGAMYCTLCRVRELCTVRCAG